MRKNNRKPIERCRKKLPQFTTMNVIDGQAGLVIYSSLIFYSLTIDNILNIIVLLILAGVTIAMLTGKNGILLQANKAKIETRAGVVQEEVDMWQITDKEEKGDFLERLEKENKLTQKEKEEVEKTGKTTIGSREILFWNQILSDIIKIGDYIKYIPNSNSTENIIKELNQYAGTNSNTISNLKQEQLNWRVMDVVDGTIRIVSENPTQSTISLYGKEGYNNAVYLLDKTCKELYSNASLSAKVQNLKLADITEEKFTELAWEKVYSYQNKVPVKYGEQREYKNANLYYPKIWGEEKESVIDGKQNGTLELYEQTMPITGTLKASNSLKVKQTYWYKIIEESDFHNPFYFELFINNGKELNYWISDRCTTAITNEAVFDIRRVNKGYIGSSLNLSYSSNTKEEENTMSFRPVVTLKNNLTIKGGDGKTSNTAYIIE